MDFLKRNLWKLIFAAGALVGVVLILIPITKVPEFNFVGAMQLAGLLIFFVGLFVYFICKMFSNAKFCSICVLLGTGVLATVALGIGAAGFCVTQDKAEGPLGKAYANYKEIAADCNDKLDKIPGLETLTQSLAVAPLSAMPTIGAIKATADTLPAGTDKTNLMNAYNGLLALNAEFTDETSMTVAKATADGTYAQLVANKSALEDGAKRAGFVATTLIFVYLAMILTFGLGPLAKGSHKLVRRFCNKEQAAA